MLDAYAPELDYLVGTAVTAEAAVEVLRRRGLSKDIAVLSYYYSPGVHRGIKRGNILAAPSDQQALQARIAVDVMVRLLQKREHLRHVAPRVVLIDGSNLRDVFFRCQSIEAGHQGVVECCRDHRCGSVRVRFSSDATLYK